MGLHNRDYARDGGRGSSFGGGGAYGGFTSDRGGVVKKIIIATVAVFILQVMLQSPVRNELGDRSSQGLQQFEDPITNWFAVQHYRIVKQGQVWRLLTYAFLHSRDSLFHIFFNLLMLWFLGREMESLYGSKEFLWFYLVSAVFAGVCYVLVGLVLQAMSGRPFGYMIGASGAVTACTMLYALHYPRRKIYVYGIIGVEMRFLMAFVLFMDIYPLAAELLGIRAPDISGSNVAHSCHLGGALFGWFYFKRQFRLSSLVNGVGLGSLKTKVKARKSKLKVYAPDDQPKPKSNARSEVSGEQVDAILEKISRDGEESLTDREREILKQASKQYRGQ